ncbi:MAG: 4Fe-4S binding protein [Deltaproteobacteria bacterium]|nr:4Fe-4S binding protein [Deltaproteobacteria bacterium]
MEGEIRIGLGSCCVASGSEAIREAVEETVHDNGLRVKLKSVGCVGMCHQVPLMEIVPTQGKSVLYTHVDPKDVKSIIEKHFNPPSLLKKLSVKALSGVRGRGGAGFSSGVKWDLVARQKAAVKYVICNGDEGDPGAFMDRMLLESYPYRVIEGMLIAGFAVGAKEGYFYIRAEYPLAVTRIRQALQLCREAGIIGPNIFGSSYSFDIHLYEGAGAFVCGEETALIASLEGKRGFPHLRPPYPAESGLWNAPTLVNNTETFALVSWIIRKGAPAFNRLGTDKSKGTKVFALAGKINRGGLIEVPMGITIREIVEEIGGGIANGKKFKAIQIGGPSGGCIPESLADTPIDFESDILDRLCTGKGKADDLAELEKLAGWTRKGSLCGLGQTAPNPVLTTLRYFRDEYEAHLAGHCPTGKCVDLIKYTINDKCIGCSLCAQKCPVDAIEFRPHEQHEIDLEKCIKCDTCRLVCPVDAVIKS